jgi:hypothetical protein
MTKQEPYGEKSEGPGPNSQGETGQESKGYSPRSKEPKSKRRTTETASGAKL